MKYIFFLIVIYILIIFFLRIKKEKTSVKFLSGKNPILENGKYPIFHIIIPVFDEQKVIIDSLNHILKINYPKDKFDINFDINIVGTVSEHTIDYLKENISNYGDFVNLFVSPKLGKSNQVNYVVDKINDKTKNVDNEYIIVYDADSNPSKNSLQSFRYKILEFKFPVALQQSTIYLKNFNRLGYYGKIESIFQFNRVLIYEVFGQLRSISSRIAYTYMVGHGMCIKLDFLLKTGKFSTPYDDVHMGQRLRLFGEKIIPVNTMDIADTAISLMEIIRQSGGWLLGGLISTEFSRINHLNNKKFLQKFWPIIYLKGIFDTISWFSDGLFILFIIFCSFFNIYFLFLILLWELFSFINLQITVNFAKRLGIKINNITILLLLGSLIRPIIRMFSILSAIYIIYSGKIKRAKR